MRKSMKNNFIWVFMLELIFLIFLAFELYIGSVPTNVLNTKEWYLIFSPYQIHLSFARLFGSIPVGVLGIVFAKRTGRLRIPTIIASVINILASAAMFALFALIFVGAMLGEIHV